jgi:hypothetical protein
MWYRALFTRQEFGKIPAIDMASVSNGHVYHTANDDARNVRIARCMLHAACTSHFACCTPRTSQFA